MHVEKFEKEQINAESKRSELNQKPCMTMRDSREVKIPRFRCTGTSSVILFY
jgi:hypothetical protein